MEEHRLGWLALAWFDGFGSRTLRKIRVRFRDGWRAFSLSREDLLGFGVTNTIADRFCEWRGNVDAEMFSRRCAAEGIRFVLDEDSEYPSYLKHSSDPPFALFMRGEPLCLARPVAIVGTRAMTGYGERVTAMLGRELALAGCEIISGLALGIDAKAHEAALDVGGKTVAVLAGGCNDNAIYPRQNAPLAMRILANRGTIVTELPPGTESFRHLFPVRNRIIASLTVATIVVEAADSSGSLITAKLALEENRDVFAVPGPVTSEQSSGTNQLLKQGAIPCTCADDVLALFDLKRPQSFVPVEVSDNERQILEILDRPLHIDELIRALDCSASAVSSILSAIELKGLVEHQGGGMYARTPLGRKCLQNNRHPESDEGVKN